MAPLSLPTEDSIPPPYRSSLRTLSRSSRLPRLPCLYAYVYYAILTRAASYRPPTAHRHRQTCSAVSTVSPVFLCCARHGETADVSVGVSAPSSSGASLALPLRVCHRPLQTKLRLGSFLIASPYLVQAPTVGPRPKNVPPPTPVVLPQCNPRLEQGSPSQHPLVTYLQSLHRPGDVSESHFAALGVHVHTDVSVEALIPDTSYLPPPEWDSMTMEQARDQNDTFQRPLSNGRSCPGPRSYLERKSELSNPNQAAFRTVRRIRPEPGTQAVRLGNFYEFFKQMENIANYWDDTSLPPLSDIDESNSSDDQAQGDNSTAATVGGDAAEGTKGSESNTRSQSLETSSSAENERVTYRSSPGSGMPPEFRHNMVSAFVKVLVYDFGCNLSAPRVEPRMHLIGPTASSKSSISSPRCSYIPSGCVFVSRTPTSREQARASIVEGPVVAVSARNTTTFNRPSDSNIDFGREVVAAIATAQLRAREGKPEKRFGEGKWWATEKRWGGGEGGPIGREVEGNSAAVGDKDATSTPTASSPSLEGSSSSPDLSGAAAAAKSPQSRHLPVPLPLRGQPMTKRPRRNMSIYDNYRQLRAPATNWDRKAHYEAIGRVPGADYDDVFIVSSLFHHLCVLRFRVPAKLLAVLDGEPEKGVDGKDDNTDSHDTTRSWGKLEVWRTPWYDMFVAKDRIGAMRALWGMMSWLMRKNDDEGAKAAAQTTTTTTNDQQGGAAAAAAGEKASDGKSQGANGGDVPMKNT